VKPKASKNPESVVRKIKRKTRRKFNSEEKIRIILEGLKPGTRGRPYHPMTQGKIERHCGWRWVREDHHNQRDYPLIIEEN
jgi:transposase-like protein